MQGRERPVRGVNPAPAEVLPVFPAATDCAGD